MRIEPGTFCPLLKKDCIQNKCAWFIKVVGTDKNTGKEVDEWGCTVSWLPVLMIENSSEQRQTGAAVESFRNEMVKANKTNTDVLKRTMITAQERERRPALGYNGDVDAVD
jgi:hypothetical protein